MTDKIALELLHGRRSMDERLDNWGIDGPIFLVDHVHLTYMGNLRLGPPAPLGVSELLVVSDLVYYDGVYFGDWSVVSPTTLDAEQRTRISSFDLAKAKLPTLGTCTCCRHYQGVLECRGLDCQRCEACDPD